MTKTDQPSGMQDPGTGLPMSQNNRWDRHVTQSHETNELIKQELAKS
jgi:hypothetical protein